MGKRGSKSSLARLVIPEFRGLGTLDPPADQPAKKKENSQPSEAPPTPTKAPKTTPKKLKVKKRKLKTETPSTTKSETASPADSPKPTKKRKRQAETDQTPKTPAEPSKKKKKAKATAEAAPRAGGYTPGALSQLLGSGDKTSSASKGGLFDAKRIVAKKPKRKAPEAEGKKGSEAAEDGQGKVKPQRTFDPEESRRTVFIGNLDVNVKRSELKALLTPFGAVESVRLRSAAAPEDSKLPKKAALATHTLSPHCNRLVAYAKFEAESSVGRAVAGLNGTELGGRVLRVDDCRRAKPTYSPSHSVFVGNLPYAVDEEILRQHFTTVGKVEAVRIVRDSRTQLGKGFGFVSFVGEGSVGLALRLNGQPLTDTKRPLRVTSVSAEATKRASEGKGAGRGGFSGPRKPRHKKTKKALDTSAVAVNLKGGPKSSTGFQGPKDALPKAAKKSMDKKRKAKTLQAKKKSLMS